jgi:hypothetical protein
MRAQIFDEQQSSFSESVNKQQNLNQNEVADNLLLRKYVAPSQSLHLYYNEWPCGRTPRRP